MSISIISDPSARVTRLKISLSGRISLPVTLDITPLSRSRGLMSDGEISAIRYISLKHIFCCSSVMSSGSGATCERYSSSRLMMKSACCSVSSVVFKRKLLYPKVEIIVVPGAPVEQSGGSAEGIYPPDLFLGSHQVTAILVELSTATPRLIQRSSRASSAPDISAMPRNVCQTAASAYK